jgi:hypothetical protein
LSNARLKGSTFVVAGHTDAIGSKAYNQDHSERRADTIKRCLTEIEFVRRGRAGQKREVGGEKQHNGDSGNPRGRMIGNRKRLAREFHGLMVRRLEPLFELSAGRLIFKSIALNAFRFCGH